VIPWFYAFIRWLCWVMLKIGWRFRSIGAEHVPADGAVIVAANHVSYFDPVALGCGMRRPLTYLAKKELFDIPVLGPIIAGLGAYPTDRNAGGAAALRAALRVLKEGRCVGIFPEGTRNRAGDAPQKGGAALLASLSGATVVPAAIVGTREVRRFHQIRVVYGQPFRIERERARDRKADGDDVEKWTVEIMRRIRALEESVR
jgi:1-acyl-sn-glycerol-3-phosphate acyltransferase